MKVTMELWQVKVTDGVMGMVHGQFFEITEFYIPKYQIAFNLDKQGEAGKVNVFKTTRRERYGRNPDGCKRIETYEVKEEFAKSLNKYLKDKGTVCRKCIEVIKCLDR